MKDLPILFVNKNECTGCGACFNICRANAISMTEDEEGFNYPSVDEEKCIRCYKCTDVCTK